MSIWRKIVSTMVVPLLLLLAISGSNLWGQEVAQPDVLKTFTFSFDNIVLFLAAVFVLFMQAGFSALETGLNSAKNSVNIMFKNLVDLCIGMLLFWFIGYSLMYPGGNFAGSFFGFSGTFGIGSGNPVDIFRGGGLHPQVDFFFQAAFAATAATIVSGAVSGRLKFSVYLIYSAVITALVYPISGMWHWGGGWLKEIGFHDFAGSLIVHAVGGFAGLAGTIILGPRIGKFGKDGKPRAVPGSNLPLATIGVFILWVGWYGFNPGSQLTFTGEANIHAVMLIAVNTSLAAAAGGAAAMLITWFLHKKPELSMTLNGVLAGLVGITAGCDVVTNLEAVVIGLVGGILVVLGVKLLDKIKIDDPVGAWPVHGLAGLWGGISTGIFGEGGNLLVQTLGSLAIVAWSFITMYFLFFIINKIVGIRVSEEEELKGLDVGEHGEEAYKGFQIYTLE